MKSQGSKAKSGIALFVLLTSLIILSLAIREMIVMTGLQADRVRYQYNRLQAIYLARSAQNIARFFLIFDKALENFQKGNPEAETDSLSDLWAKPVPLPFPSSLVQSLGGSLLGKEGEVQDKAQSDEEAEALKKCDTFFEDFSGNAVSQTSDMNSRLDLNSLSNEDTFETLKELLQSDPAFVTALTNKGRNPTSIAREIRDFMDDNDREEETESAEDDVYRAEQLDYGAKNRPFAHPDELRMIPSMDDEIFEFLSPYVSAVYLARTPPPTAKINLNTVSKTLFQSLLMNVSDPAQVAEEFVKDRKEKERLYTDKTAKADLESRFGLDSKKIRLSLLGGRSDLFKIETTSQVNEVEVTLESYIGRGFKKPFDPFIIQRISP